MRRWLALGIGILLLGAAPASAEEDPVAAGQRAYDQGDLAGALVQWSLALQAARGAEDAGAEFDALLRLATVNRELGRTAAAGDLLGTAEPLATDPIRVARLDGAAGLLALSTGDARRAERLLTRAFQGHQGASDPQGAANAATNLGLARRALGKRAEADRAFAAALTLFEALGDRDGQGDALTNRGSLQRSQGQLRDALDSLERAVALYQASGNVGGEADAQLNLGRVLQDLGRDGEAETLYEAALATARDRKDVPRQAALLMNLGTLAQRRGDATAAAAHYQAAEEAFAGAGRQAQAASAALNRASLGGGDAAAFEELIQRAKRGNDRRLEAIGSLNLAALRRTSDPAAATAAAQRALRLATQLELADVRWRAQYVSALLDLDAGRDQAGIAGLREAVDGLEQARRGLDADAEAAFVTDHQEVYQALIDALLRGGDSLGAFVYAERLQRQDLPAATPDPDDPDALRLAELAGHRDWLEGQLADELSGHGDDTERGEALRAELAAARVAFAEHVDHLRTSHPHFDSLVRVDPEDLEAVQATLPDGVVVLQPILLPDRLELLVFRRDGLSSHTVDVEAAVVEKAIRRLTRSLRAGDTFDPAWTDELCAQLGGWLVAPLEAELADASVLVVSQSGPLRQLPFALLRHDDRYLVERVAIVGVTHVGSLRERDAGQPRFRVEGERLLLVGNPDGTLPGAEAEVEAVAGMFPGAVSLVGAGGTRQALTDQAGGRTALHLATHGVIDGARPERSYLVLAPGASDDGHLSYREIPGMAPYLGQARLVVLSACESSLPVAARDAGDDGAGAISINGLAAQFRRAGVETLVGTLWKVDDAATLALMTGFYEELDRGADVGRSLQAAQQRMLATPTHAHPYFWAGFVAVGDWR